MDGWQNRLKYIGRKVGKVKTWHLVVVLVVLVILSIVFLRLNSIRMIELRDEVMTADASGNAKVLQESVAQLQGFVSRHMNTDTGQIALQDSYNRAVQKAFAGANDNIDPGVYARASNQCKSVLRVSGYQSYATCIADTVGVNKSKLKTPELLNPALFYLSYASPALSFDLAGVAVVLSIVVFFVIIIKLATEVILYFISKKRQ